ncbi:hypothetical protein [Streptomyces lavendulocolor]|uniref:hypothetical protein n=1 Tax=Streptomyces lavendulocolor TaxID=67316 RepID=UPI0033F49979
MTSTYTPPLTSTPQPSTTNTSALYGPCVSQSNPALTQGSRKASVSFASRSCLDLLDSTSVSFTIQWNTGQSSTVAGNASTTIVGASRVLVVTGNVTAGLFAGDSFVQTAIAPATDITLCTLGLGSVSSLYSVVTLEITSL